MYPQLFEGSGDGYVAVDIVANEYTFAITAPGTEFVLDAGTILLGAERYYLFVAIGTPEDPDYLLIPTDIPE
jgi:hypothetical protein